MNSSTARAALVGALSAVIAVLLVAAGFLGRVALEGGGGSGAAAPAASEARPAAASASGGDGIGYELLDEIVEVLENKFVEPDRIDRELLYEGAINGLFQALGDPHSLYIDPQTYAVSRDDFSGAFEGIGATVSRQDEYVVIVQPLPDTPAERAGVRAGDLILAVDGEDAQGWSVEQAVLRIRGQRGTEVVLTVRHSDGSEETIPIVRDNILVASITAAPPGGVLRDADGEAVTNIGYVRIRNFTARTPQELGDLVRQLEEDGAAAIILDVRGNPGGLLVETAQTTDPLPRRGRDPRAGGARWTGDGVRRAAGDGHVAAAGGRAGRVLGLGLRGAGGGHPGERTRHRRRRDLVRQGHRQPGARPQQRRRRLRLDRPLADARPQPDRGPRRHPRRRGRAQPPRTSRSAATSPSTARSRRCAR